MAKKLTPGELRALCSLAYAAEQELQSTGGTGPAADAYLLGMAQMVKDDPAPDAASRTVLLVYDIPETLNHPNPSGILRRHGVRVNLSCWMVPAERLNRKDVEGVLSGFKQAGIEYHILRFDLTEEDKIKAIARGAVEKETARIHTSLIRTLDRAAEAYAAARQAVEADEALHWVAADERINEAWNRRVKRCRQAVRTAADMLEATIKAAEAFDETMNVQDCLDGLKKALAARKAALQAELGALAGI